MPSKIILNTELVYSACLFIAAIAVAATWIKRGVSPLTKPYKDLRFSVDKHNKSLDNNNARIQRLESIAEENKEDTKIIMKSLLVLLEHAETGNATGECHEGKEKLQNYLADK